MDTKGLPGGNYKVEVQYIGADEPRLRSDSVTLQLVKLIDRSGDITITSPMTQNADDALRIEGSITKLGDNGVKIEVRGPDGVTLRDEWIGTKEDLRSGAGVSLPNSNAVTGGGDYDVMFTDAKGFIGIVTFHVRGQSTPVITTLPTTIATVKTTRVPTTAPTPWPTATQVPAFSHDLFSLGIIGAGLVVAFVMKRT
ncbi:MAG: hypothetical protein MZV63_17405 [Marinilabiliales bacterium]|nr:hypothetical protein [Marinilabiliales bacterium]